MKQVMISGQSEQSKLAKWLLGTLFSGLLIGMILIIVEKMLDYWLESEPTEHQSTMENQVPLASFIPDCQNIQFDDRITQLKCLTNPQAPLSISLWLDKPGKMQFISGQPAVVGYQVNGLAKDTKNTMVYLTLFNISPTGKLSVVFTETVAVGKIYGQLSEKSNVAVVKQVDLEVGQEYFKALVTSKPIATSTFLTAMMENLRTSRILANGRIDSHCE
jgi:hypothetical protein